MDHCSNCRLIESICCEMFLQDYKKALQDYSASSELLIFSYPQNMMKREDIRVVKNAFKDPKNCQNREQKLNYHIVGV